MCTKMLKEEVRVFRATAGRKPVGHDFQKSGLARSQKPQPVGPRSAPGRNRSGEVSQVVGEFAGGG